MVQIDMFGRGWKLQLAITAACSMAFILFGYDQGVFSGIVGNDHFLDVVGHPNDTLLGIIVAVYNLGCFTGCIAAFCFGETLGRRRAMWVAMAWIIVGGALQASAYSRGHMIAARFITGIGTGMETSTVPMYQAELSHAHNRGRLVCSEPLFVGVGIEPDHPSIKKEKAEILHALSLEGEAQKSWLHIFQQDEVQTGKRVLLAYGMQFMNQVGGINLVVQVTCIQIMFPLGSIIPALGADKLGRRRPMMWGSFGLGICMMMISILLSFKNSSIGEPTASASVAFFFVYMFIFGASCNCIPWVYVPEILPLRARARGTAIGISSNWLWLYTTRGESPIKISKRIRKEKQMGMRSLEVGTSSNEEVVAPIEKGISEEVQTHHEHAGSK
ncbi:Sugar transporter STL1 [Lasiodiplodia theobromae]|uniref:Sugar transporter STL1 n=1 Tax=Lasiodiplodia theobromae TaxID=45133 RepID=A0A5N5DNZ2_9PEZI|nr:Sugar transporter STL1 [Lasiodiplodia theobromae]